MHTGVSPGRRSAWSVLAKLRTHGREIRPRAFGAHVVVFTTSPDKEGALHLGADEVVVSTNADEMQKHTGGFGSSSIPSPPLTVTPISTCKSVMATPPWSAALPRSPWTCGIQPDHGAPQSFRLKHRRHCRNPGDARLCAAWQPLPPMSIIPIREGQQSSLRATLLESDVKYLYRYMASAPNLHNRGETSKRCRITKSANLETVIWKSRLLGWAAWG